MLAESIFSIKGTYLPHSETSLPIAFPQDRPLAVARRLWLLVLVTSLMLGVSACREKARIALASKEKASSLTPSQLHKTGSIENYRLYVDASESMAGFAGQGDESDFGRLLGSLDTFTEYQVFKYGYPKHSKVLTVDRTTQDLTRKEAYQFEYNPDNELIEKRILNDGEKTLSVIITDGVYSEPDQGRPKPVVEAIKQWIEKGHTLGILVFKSRFRGKFWSERQRNWLGCGGKVNKLPCQGYVHDIAQRPFYAFVFSPTLEGFKELQGRLKRKFPSPSYMDSFVFADDMIRISAVKVIGNVKGFFGSSSPPKTPYYWQMFDSALFKQGNPAVIPLQIQYTVSPGYPVKELNPAVILSEYYLWKVSRSTSQKGQQGEASQKEGFELESERPPGLRIDNGASEEPNGKTNKSSRNESILDFKINLHLPQDARSSYSHYCFRLGAQDLNLQSAIGDLSTLDDSNKNHTSKTYRFDELMRALTQDHLKARLDKLLFLAVANR
jgi:hypothetical protein